MKHIRPHTVMDLIDEDSRMAHIYIHPKAPMMLETAIHISLLKYVKPAKYFEFGTYLGINALNVARNMLEFGKVITLDLDDFAFQQANIVTPDIPIAEEHLRNMSKLAFIDTPYEKQITCLYGDSNTYDFSKFEGGGVEMVYVDGGHDIKTLHSDTENALKMLPEHGLSCIIWHDYQNPNYNVTQYLDELSTNLTLYHIEETMTVFYLKNAPEEIA